MRLRTVPAVLLGLAIGLTSCGREGPTAPDFAQRVAPRFAGSSHPTVRFSEIHYDNGGTAPGEAWSGTTSRT